MKKQKLIIFGVLVVICTVIFLFINIPRVKQKNINEQNYKSNVFNNTCRKNIIFKEVYYLSKYNHNTSIHNLYKLFSSQYLSNMNISEKNKHLWVYSISKYSRKYSIPESLILAIIWKESSFNEKAVSSKNAKGPMQVVVRFHRDKLSTVNKTESDLLTISTGIHIGCMIFKNYYDISNGDIILTLQKYYGKKDYAYINDILSKYVLLEAYLVENN